MNDYTWFLFSEKTQMAIAGAAGGVVRWLSLRENWKDGSVSVVVGCICAMYLGPVTIPILEPVVGKITADASARAGLSCFLIGLGGVGVSGFFIDFWRARRSLLNPPADKEKGKSDDPRS